MGYRLHTALRTIAERKVKKMAAPLERLLNQGNDSLGAQLEDTGIWQAVEGIDPDQPIFTIGTASNMLEIHPRTLRIYEKEGLIKPLRKGQRRYFSLNDLQWITCIRSMIHDQGISIAGIKKLLEFTGCWNIVNCPTEKRKNCTAYKTHAK